MVGAPEVAASLQVEEQVQRGLLPLGAEEPLALREGGGQSVPGHQEAVELALLRHGEGLLVLQQEGVVGRQLEELPPEEAEVEAPRMARYLQAQQLRPTTR